MLRSWTLCVAVALAVTVPAALAEDPKTPIEETMEALHDVVKVGKARYLGASSMFAWQFCKALYLADRHGWARFISMQDHLNRLASS